MGPEVSPEFQEVWGAVRVITWKCARKAADRRVGEGGERDPWSKVARLLKWNYRGAGRFDTADGILDFHD